jgi:DNA-binding HxlR family transcriptional regulator
MATKTYGQMCPLARSLDVLGERWTLLVLRELLLGPRRFKYLLATFPSLGANRLSARLSSLADAGVVHKAVLPEPASVAVYELTPLGEQLRGPVVALSLWGLALPMDERIDPATARADLVALGLTATQTEPLDPARRENFQFDVGDEQLHLQLRDGRVLARSGPSLTPPDLWVACGLQTFMALALRGTTPSQAIGDRHLTILRGTTDTLEVLFDVLVYQPPMAAADH